MLGSPFNPHAAGEYAGLADSKQTKRGSMKKTWLYLAIALALAVPVVPTASADDKGGPNVVDPNSVVFGRTYSQWSAQWEQWAYSIPASHHPLFDTTSDCSVGQSGPVWFLGGKFCYNTGTCSFTVVRTCTIPSTKALYFPIIDSEDSALEEDVAENPGNINAQQVNAMRQYTATNMDPAVVRAWVDGEPIPKLQQRFRVQSPAFGFTLPVDNLLAAVYPTGSNNFKEGTYFPQWMMETGVSCSGHSHRGVTKCNSEVAIGTFNLSVKYYLNVVK